MQLPRVNSVVEVGEALAEKSVAILKLPSNALRASDEVFSNTDRFFEMDEDKKWEFSVTDIQEGFRAYKSERDARTGRPDLSESYKVWFRNRNLKETQQIQTRNGLHKALNEALEPFVEIIEGSAQSLAMAIGGSANRSRLDFRSETYLQVNYSRPSRETRTTITDMHEDGHILTIVRPSAPGLVVSYGEQVRKPTQADPIGQFEPTQPHVPVEMDSDEVLIFGSVPTFYLTGGIVKPLFHSVRCLQDARRKSLIMFANPKRVGSIAPWAESGEQPAIDVQTVIDASNYSHLARHQWHDRTLAGQWSRG